MNCYNYLKIYLGWFILILIIILLIKYLFSPKRTENFISKMDLNKNVIVVIMKDTVPNHMYKAINNYTCGKLINDCSVVYNKDIIRSKQKINITNDLSLKTSSKKKNIVYIIIYNKKEDNKYNKKFIKKWCNNKNKNKDNYILVDYDTIYIKSPDIIKEISTKLDIKFDISSIISNFM